MSGYMIAEVWCDICGDREVSEDEGPLRGHRENLREQGWRRKRPATAGELRAAATLGTHNRLIDVCPDCAADPDNRSTP